ncbi:homocysteine S-methyltransferase [Oesophagostomum dentatum]|uniref:Homocysteine S-methyltransferase n=1 Tax=Oesophagostomum dentatum TaxID=61180 RepID=A0A0B1THH1_OESDE|nr:homocysteine S-methyltransferase [Oesophagostomum dentatum]
MLIQKAVSLLTETSSTYCPKKDRRIWGAIGSYATCFRGQAAEYTGSYVDNSPPNEILKTLTDYHKEQIKAVVAAGLNNLLFETVSSLLEAQAISDALRICGFEDVKAVVSFTCKKNGNAVRHGEPFSEVVKLVLENPKVVGFGINCTHPAAITPLLESVQSLVSDKEVFIYPNSGQHEQEPGEEDPLKIILRSIEKWIHLGATVIGGCCGLGADNIQEIRKKVDSLYPDT